MSPTYYKLRRAKLQRRSRLGVEARAKKRMLMGEDWKTFERVLRVAFSPCGRYVSVESPTGWHRCGSERTVRAAIARALWKCRKLTS